MKSEARNPNFETISDAQNRKYEHFFSFGSLTIWISDFSNSHGLFGLGYAKLVFETRVTQ